LTSSGTIPGPAGWPGAFDRRVLEAADAVELGFGQPVQQVLEVFFGFAREADDEGRTDDQSGQISRQFLMRARVLSSNAGRFMP
jgi:hypothetical protein